LIGIDPEIGLNIGLVVSEGTTIPATRTRADPSLPALLLPIDREGLPLRTPIAVRIGLVQPDDYIPKCRKALTAALTIILLPQRIAQSA
jgi:ethanolamine ammonia-lyase small subunit